MGANAGPGAGRSTEGCARPNGGTSYGSRGETDYDRFERWILEAWPMHRSLGLLLIVLGVIANNVVYLQDLWLGQNQISLDGWRSYAGLLISFVIIIVGMVLLARSRTPA
jgi:hypothetical protein